MQLQKAFIGFIALVRFCNCAFSKTVAGSSRTARTAGTLLLLLTLPAVVQAQFTFTTNNGTITITKYTGSGGAVTIPSTTNGYSVTTIGPYAFEYCTNLTSITIATNVTNIGMWAFNGCSKLTNITLGNISTTFGEYVFASCTNLTSVIIPARLTALGDHMFASCTKLTSVYFKGNAPTPDPTAFQGDAHAIAYYLQGTTGWGSTFSGIPTALWLPQVQSGDGSFGVRNNQFGFNINWVSGNVVVRASTNLVNPDWSVLKIISLTNGSAYFSDPQWTNYHRRFYRLDLL